jgi:hypothetical protein
MNAIAKAKAVEAAPAVLPEEIRAKLTEAKARFGALTTRQMELAEKSVQSPAIEAEYFRVIDEMSKVSGDLERYQLAISAMDRRATEQLKAAEAAEIAALCGRTSDLLEHRIQAAARFCSRHRGREGHEGDCCAWKGSVRQLAGKSSAAKWCGVRG